MMQLSSNDTGIFNEGGRVSQAPGEHLRAVNIALVNELKMLFDGMGLDVWEVIEAATTKPFGFQAFIRDLDWAGTVFRSIRFILPGRLGV